MDTDLKTMFEDARKEIRKKIENENQFSNKKYQNQNSFLIVSNVRDNYNGFGDSDSKNSSYRLSSSYLPPSALNYNSRDISKLSGSVTAPL